MPESCIISKLRGSGVKTEARQQCGRKRTETGKEGTLCQKTKTDLPTVLPS